MAVTTTSDLNSLYTAAISARVYKTLSPTEGAFGLYLRGTALSLLDIMGGVVS